VWILLASLQQHHSLSFLSCYLIRTTLHLSHYITSLFGRALRCHAKLYYDFLKYKKKKNLIELFIIIVKLNPSKFYASGSLFALVLAQYHLHMVKLESTSIMHYYSPGGCI